MSAKKEAENLMEKIERGEQVAYDDVKNLVSSAMHEQPTEQPDEGISFAIIQADISVDHSIKRNMAAEDRLFIRNTLGKITKFFIDQIGAIGFLPNTEELIVVTCFEFVTHDGGSSNGAEFAKEIKRVRPQAQVFVYEKGQSVTPDDIKGGIVDGLIKANTNDPDDHSALLQFLRNHLLSHRISQLEKRLESM
ncbi:MAG: hypothetical protein U9M90_02875 [Patescibacteria group bacterium]|nr:hypothetical protein [Patescibacteria group bacterium]